MKVNIESDKRSELLCNIAVGQGFEYKLGFYIRVSRINIQTVLREDCIPAVNLMSGEAVQLAKKMLVNKVDMEIKAKW